MLQKQYMLPFTNGIHKVEMEKILRNIAVDGFSEEIKIEISELLDLWKEYLRGAEEYACRDLITPTHCIEAIFISDLDYDLKRSIIDWILSTFCDNKTSVLIGNRGIIRTCLCTDRQGHMDYIADIKRYMKEK